MDHFDEINYIEQRQSKDPKDEIEKLKILLEAKDNEIKSLRSQIGRTNERYTELSLIGSETMIRYHNATKKIEALIGLFEDKADILDEFEKIRRLPQ